MDIEELLFVWGMWKRNYVIGIGWSSVTIESKIMSGEIMGDGNSGGGKRGGVSFVENPLAESVDIAVKKLSVRHRQEMKVIKARYITEWSVKRIAKELSISKYQTGQLLDRGKTLIEGSIV